MIGKHENENRNRYTCSSITTLALLAGLNASLELFIGNYLHAIKFPLTGSVMVGINLIIYVLGYTWVPKKGTILTVGFITAAANLLLCGTFKIWAILAILVEAAIIESIISRFGIKTWTVILAGVSANLFTFFMSIGLFSLLAPQNMPERVMAAFTKIIGSRELVQRFLILSGVIVTLIHVASGVIFGLMALKVRTHLGVLKAARESLN